MIPIPVVGEAIVHVRVSSANLGNDIRDSVTRGVRLSSGDVDREGNRVGQRFANGVGDGVRDGRSRTDREAETTARSMTQRITQEVNRSRPLLANLFGRNASNMMSKFKDEFNLGIGAARMGPAVISALNLAGPSMISGAGQIAAAMGAEIVSVLGAIGPQIAGAIGVGIAAVSTLALNAGLLMLAFKFSGDVLHDFTTRLDKLKNSFGTPIAEGMLAGLNDAMSSLEGLLPQINDLLRTTGERFGDVARGIGTVLSRADNLGRIRGILQTNNAFIDNFGRGINGLTSSFLILFNAAKPFIDYIGESIQVFGEWAEQALIAAEANGTLSAWMDKMLNLFKQLAGTVADFGKGFANVFKAAEPVSAKIRESMQKTAEAFKNWTGDPANQARMTAFFEKAHTIMSAIYDMIGKIFTAWGKAFENSNIEPLLHVFQVIGDVIAPAIGKIFNQIQAAVGPQLVKILDNIGTIFTNIANSGAIGKVAGMVADLVLAFTDLLAKISENDIGATLLGIGVGALLFGGMITSAISVITTLGGALATLGAPVLAIAAAFVFIYTQSQALRDAIAELASVIWDSLKTVWEWLQPAVEMLWPALQRLAETIGNLLAPVIQALAPVVGVLLEVIGAFVVGAIYALTLFADFLNGLLSGNWQPFIDDTMAIFGPLVPWFEGFWNGMVVVWQTTIGPLITILISIWQTIYDNAMAFWNGTVELAQGIWTNLVIAWNMWVMPIIQSLAAIWQTLWDNAQTIWNAIVFTAQAIWTGLVFAWQMWIQPIVDILVNVWMTIWNNAVSLWNGIVAVAQGIWTNLVIAWQMWVQPIIAILEGIWNTIRSTAENIWNTIVGIASSTWSNVVEAILSVVLPVVSAIADIWNTITSNAQAIWSDLQGAAASIWEGIKFAIVGPIESAWATLQGIFSSIASAVTGIISTVSSAFDTVNSKYESMLATQAAASAIPAATSTSVQGLLGASTGVFGTPAHAGWNDGIFGLAKGGIVAPVPGGRQFIIGEARRPERVEPLNANGLSSRDSAMIDHIVQAMSGMSSGGAGDVNVRVQIGEHELRDVITRVVQAHETSLARRVKGSRGLTA